MSTAFASPLMVSKLQLARMGYTEMLQQHLVGHRKDGGIGADGQRERSYSD